MSTLLPGPETDVFRPLKVLKQGPHGTVVLVQEAISGELMVARQIPVADTLEGVVDALEQAPSFVDLGDQAGLSPLLAILTRQRQVWAISQYVLGYPLDYAVKQARFSSDLVLHWTRQLLLTLAKLQPWTCGTLEPSDVVVGVQGACLVDLHLFEHAYPQRAARARMNERNPFWGPEVGRSFTIGPTSDVYSIGSLAIWLLTGDAASTDVPESLLDLVNPDPTRRPTAAEAAARLPESTAHIYQVLPVLNVQIPVPWLDAGFMIESARVTTAESLATTGRRLRESTRMVPDPTPPVVATPRLPSWLDERLAACVIGLAVVLGGLVWLGRPGAVASSGSVPTAVDKGGLTAVTGHFYVRARGEKTWANVLSTQRLQGQLLASPRVAATTVTFARGSRLVLDRAALVDYENSPTQGYRFTLRQGRMAVLLSPDDAGVMVSVGECRATLPAHSLVELDARAYAGLPRSLLASYTQTLSVDSAGQTVTVAPQQRVVLSGASGPAVQPVPGDLDDWERATLRQ